MEFEIIRSESLNRLPDDIACSVGHIAYRFSILEHVLKMCIYKLVGVSNVVGRLAIGTARAEDQVSKIEDLMTHARFVFDPPLTEFKKLVAKAERSRDSIIHGEWAKDSTGTLILIELTGKWDVGTKTPRVTRRMYPAGRPTTNDDLLNIYKEIDSVAKMAWNIYNRLPASIDRSPSPTAPDHPIDDRNQNKSSDPQSPSQASPQKEPDGQ